MRKSSLFFFKFLLVSIFWCFTNASAQQKADKYFSEYAYSKAIVKYEKYLKKHSDNVKAWANLGDCYRLTNNMQGAERAYSHVINTTFTKPPITFRYAQALIVNKKYAEAREVFDKYKTENPDDTRASEIVNALDSINRLYTDSAIWKLERISINSTNGDFCPVYFRDGIVFTSNRDRPGWIGRRHTWTGKQFNTLYFSRGKDAQFEEPVKFADPVTTKYNNGPVSFNGNADEMFYTRNNIENGKVVRSNNKVVKLKIFSARLSNNNWDNEISFDYNNNQYSVAHPALSADGNELYFSSDMMGGYGGMDIYKCVRAGNKWSRPVNMGPAVNTRGNEVFPFIAPDSTLYFASDGHGGLGGLDIFYCSYGNQKLSNPVNAGYPINSSNDDFGIVCRDNGKTGYLSSNRNNQGGDDDIYYFSKKCAIINGLVYDDQTLNGIAYASVKIVEAGTDKEVKLTNNDGIFTICLVPGKSYEFIADKEGYIGNKKAISANDFQGDKGLEVKIPLHKKPPPVFDARGIVFDAGSKKPLIRVKVILYNLTDNKSDTLVTKADGKYHFENLNAETNYKLTVIKENCATASKEFSTVGMKESYTFINDFGLYCKGAVIRIDNIYYDLDKYNIRPDAATELNKLVVILNQYPSMKVELRSHTDSRGSDAYNLKLSDNRARAAADYIFTQGISKSRLTGKGYGETQLLNKCRNGIKCSDEEHQLNRRTEFKILSL